MLKPSLWFDSTMLITVATLVLTIVLFTLSRIKKNTVVYQGKPMKAPKSLPNTLPLLGNVIELSQNISRFHDWILEKSMDNNGAPWAITVPGNPAIIVISTPDIMEDVLKTQSDTFPKGNYVVELSEETIGDTIIMQSGDKWRQQRKVAVQYFTPSLLREVAVPVIRDHADRMYQILHESHTNHSIVNLSKLFDELTLNLSTDISFGLKLNSMGEQDHSFYEALNVLIGQIFERFTLPKWIWKTKRMLNLGSERKFRYSLQLVHDKVSDIVTSSLASSKERQASGNRPSTVLEMFIDCMHDEKGENQLSEAALRDIALAFILGGRDTISSTLQWLFLELLRRQDIYDTLMQALSSQIPHVMNGTKFLTLQEAQAIPYLEAVIRETLRLHPAITMTGREASKDTILSDGTFVSKGTNIILSNYSALQLKAIWGPDANEFKPERWLDASGQFVPESPFKMVAFNAGPRMCVGMSMALLELRMLIIGTLARFKLESLPNDGKYAVNIGLMLKDPLMARVTKDSSHLFQRRSTTSLI